MTYYLTQKYPNTKTSRVCITKDQIKEFSSCDEYGNTDFLPYNEMWCEITEGVEFKGKTKISLGGFLLGLVTRKDQK